MMRLNHLMLHLRRATMRPTYYAGIILFLATFGVGFAFALRQGFNSPLESDAWYFSRIALSLARGEGFRLVEGFWPDQPTMSRAPGWPFLMALPLRWIPETMHAASVRGLALGLHAVVAVLLFRITLQLTGSNRAGFLAGGFYAVYPPAIPLAAGGLSEPLFLVLVCGGTLLLLHPSVTARSGSRGGLFRMSTAMLLYGLACLVRSNFILAGLLVFPVVVMRMAWRPRVRGVSRDKRFVLQALLLGGVLFMLPSMLWAVRNYTVCGRFPVQNTLRGQTFYGANNPVVANDLEYWGYWIFPNAIPDETSMYELSHTLSEWEVDEYYYRRGVNFVRENFAAMPRLALGKLIRAYAPVPWKPSPAAYIASLFRALLWFVMLIGLVVGWRGFRYYVTLLAGMVAVNLITVVVFWGCARFALQIEPLFMPLMAWTLVHGRERMQWK